ncbi:MAG TPA: formyltetrahydrofolate deformylase [Caulobacteraceae bacterium]|nr:formyltetrahydrofolate deformylase [Caulobacteraceae bacterium]
MAQRYILLVQCPDRRGVVAAVAGYLSANEASIVESNHFNDGLHDEFFMRVVFRRDGTGMPELTDLQAGFAPIARAFDMTCSFHDASVRPRVMIAVSRFGHCLYDLLHRWRAGLLPVEITAVVSNHDDMRSFVEWNGLPYHHLPVAPGEKAAQEARMSQLIDADGVDLVVLARYMQILSPEMCARLSGRCINIHHSFLPSFKGAKPYHQAHARGVKIIGATAHYVTTDLDEGPIIEQDVARVSHKHTPGEMVVMGQEIECRVLSRAVSWHVERRVVMNGQRTIVFG